MSDKTKNIDDFFNKKYVFNETIFLDKEYGKDRQVDITFNLNIDRKDMIKKIKENPKRLKDKRPIIWERKS